MITAEQREQLNDWFRSSDLKIDEDKADALNSAALNFARAILETCPESMVNTTRMAVNSVRAARDIAAGACKVKP
jgi:hypothetical protein